MVPTDEISFRFETRFAGRYPTLTPEQSPSTDRRPVVGHLPEQSRRLPRFSGTGHAEIDLQRSLLVPGTAGEQARLDVGGSTSR
jgi:hypothetical protein